MKPLLTIGNPKTQKGLKKGYLTAVLHLAPADLSGRWNVCPWSTPGCRAACLNTAGRGGIFKPGESTNAIQKRRIERTRFFFLDKALFLSQIVKEIRRLRDKASAMGLKLAVRMNGTSDIPWERESLFDEFPEVRFYDYTKSKGRISLFVEGKMPSNYHLTYSRSEFDSYEALRLILNSGANVAVVLRDTGSGVETFGLYPPGCNIVDGDEHDLRFLDQNYSFVVLKAKGKAKKDKSGFAI